MTSHSTDIAPGSTVARPADEAGNLLAAAIEKVKLRPDPYSSGRGPCPDMLIHPSRKEEDPVRTLLALAGIGQALLALGDVLDDRLADVADTITGVQAHVAELAEAARPARRWWRRGRGGARPAIEAADRAVVRQALADAADWRRRESEADTGEAAVTDERMAHAYLALRERLAGAA
jgi:hypothetical protein